MKLTYKIIDNKYENIKYIKQDNKGPGGARNKGLEVSSGEYIYFLDIDDMIINSAIEELVSIVKYKKVDIVTFNSRDSNCNFTESYNNVYTSRDISQGYYNGRNFTYITLKRNTFHTAVWLCFYKKSFLEKIDNPFLDIIHEDCIYTIHHFVEATDIYYYNKILHKRRIHNSSITHKKISEKRVLGTFKVLEDAKNLYDGITDKKDKKMFKRWNYYCCNQALSVLYVSEYKVKYKKQLISYILRNKYLANIKCYIKLVLLLK